MIHYAPLVMGGPRGGGNAPKSGYRQQGESAMLQDEPRAYIEEQFNEKNGILAAYGEQVSATTLYEDMFGADSLADVFPVVIIGEDEKKHIVPMPLDLAIEQAAGRNDMLMGACTYFHNWISKRSARDVYGFIIDADNFYSGTLQNAMQRSWRTANDEPMPMPTYIVNSGTGLHLYYLFTEPIPNYQRSTATIDKVYRALAIQQTTKRVYLHKQVQWFGQDFRMAGGLNKYGWTNSAYRVGAKWDIDDLARAVGVQGVHVQRYAEPRRAQRAGKRKARPRRQGWRSNPAFYAYALEGCRNKTREGNRYTSMCALAVIAWKCNVPVEQLERDLKSLLPVFNKGAQRIVKESEVQSALKMYNERAMMTQRATLESWQGWEYKPTKRNGRPQGVHLRIARSTLEVLSKENGAALQGRHTEQDKVAAWRQANPDGTKAACIRETGLDKKTVYKWWAAAGGNQMEVNPAQVMADMQARVQKYRASVDATVDQLARIGDELVKSAGKETGRSVAEILADSHRLIEATNKAAEELRQVAAGTRAILERLPAEERAVYLDELTDIEAKIEKWAGAAKGSS